MLDHILAFLLIFIIPIRALWRSLSGKSAFSTKASRYSATIKMIVALSAILTVNWLISGRTAQDVGLGVPVSIPSLVGMGIAVIILTALFLTRKMKPKPSQARAIEAAQQELYPQTASEFRLFLVLCLAVGGGWEILYRGFLLYYLTPLTGLLGAVVIAAFSYGTGHGYRNPRQFAGSIASAFAFTMAYVATGNLWWLMLIHAGVMLLGAVASRAFSNDTGAR